MPLQRLERWSRQQAVILGVLVVMSLFLFALNWYQVVHLRSNAELIKKNRAMILEMQRGQSRNQELIAFLRDNMMSDPRKNVNPKDPAIMAKAKELGGNFESIYTFVKHDIRYESRNINHERDVDALKARKANCFGIASLLVSLLRASGVQPKDVRVTLGTIQGNKLHAWTEVRIEGHWVVVDATNFLGRPDQDWIMPAKDFYRGWQADDKMEFNDVTYRIRDYEVSSGFVAKVFQQEF